MIKETSKKSKGPETDPNGEPALLAWIGLQRELAEKTGLALATLQADNSIVAKVENDNSICEAMVNSREHSALCVSDCGRAAALAAEKGEAAHFQCHAGLHSFAIPLSINKRSLTVLGGRAFTSVAGYQQFFLDYADLYAKNTSQCLRDVKFCNGRDLRESAELVSASIKNYSLAAESDGSLDESSTIRDLLNAHRYADPRAGRLEIVRVSEDRKRKRFDHEQFYSVLREVATTPDPSRLYEQLVAKISELMNAQRSSLMILNEEADELTLEAAVGFERETLTPIRIKLGESVAGTVLQSGIPLVVANVDEDERIPPSRVGHYTTKSFISFPIAFGARKLGVINLTDRADGLGYDDEDLSLVEMMAPHLALVIDRAEWHKKAEQFQKMSLTDALTGLPNRRYLEERLFEEVERSKRHGTPLSFMIIDIDRFKSYNDLYGHTNADSVLVKTAQILRRNVRAIDMSSRFAGDEFCVVLPETEITDAFRIAERLRTEVGDADFQSEMGDSMGRVTISIGISSFCPSRQTPLEIIEAADRALYQAKTRGRNCVVVYEVDRNVRELQQERGRSA